MGDKESIIERAFVKKIKKDFGLRAIKFTDPGRRGGPDRLVILPGGHALFIEFKKPGEERRKEQVDYAKSLIDLGAAVLVCDNWKEPYDHVERHLQSVIPLSETISTKDLCKLSITNSKEMDFWRSQNA